MEINTDAFFFSFFWLPCCPLLNMVISDNLLKPV
jgi:hypothetical protein